MRRGRLGLLAAVFIALPALVAACGDDSNSGGTLPPMLTTIPSTTTEFVSTTTVQIFYVIQSGDTLDKIASRFSVSRADLMAVNGITNPDHIEVGQELEIPQGKVVVDTLPPAPDTTTTV